MLWRNHFLSQPTAGDLTGEDDDFNFSYETNHWFFLDAIDVLAPADIRVSVGEGSSSVDMDQITTPGQQRSFSELNVHVACTRCLAMVTNRSN